MNCRGCVNLKVNSFTGVHYCIKSGSACHVLRTNDIGSPIVADSGECPGFVSEWNN